MACPLPRHIHFIGALGRGMGAVIEAVASEAVRVTGSDRSTAYGPLRDRLSERGVHVDLGFDAAHLQPRPDLVVIARSFGRGNPEVEMVLSECIPYISLSQFLCVFFLNGSRNFLVAGSTGKTTTTAMLVQILRAAGLDPGYLIGGSPRSGLAPARLGGRLHVLEADEYTSLWWDDHAKFLDYRPDVLIITNVYPDHPDIFPDHEISLSQYRALIAQLPESGLLVIGESRLSLGMDSLLAEAPCPVVVLDADRPTPECGWSLQQSADALRFQWQDADFELAIPGAVNARNAVCAALAAAELGVTAEQSALALRGFQGVQGRLERLSSARIDASASIVYLDCYGYLPISLARNLETLRTLHPGRRLVLCYHIFIVDRLPTIRDDLHEVLLQWDEVVIIAEPMSASTNAPANTSFMNVLASDLAMCGSSVYGPVSLVACGRHLAAQQMESSVVLCTVHPSLEPRVRELVAGQVDR